MDFLINGKNEEGKNTRPFQKKEAANRLLARELAQENKHGTASLKSYNDIHDIRKCEARKNNPYIFIVDVVKEVKNAWGRMEI